jgi:hypothetical protein
MSSYNIPGYVIPAVRAHAPTGLAEGCLQIALESGGVEGVERRAYE